MPRARIMSGMRPTGRLHLGNYLGALENWVRLQDEYECFFSIVDWHALTTGYEDTSAIREDIREMAVDWLSAGLDPDRSTFYVQSRVKEVAELHLLLSMVTPVSWLERVPTYKDQLQQLAGKDINTYGFLGYPLLQTADIVIFKADFVPVGEDQLPHLELAREVVRRFNNFYGPVFPEPQAQLNQVTMLPGIDGRKMSKSYGNDIGLAATAEEIKGRVDLMITDPARIRKSDPGHPEVCTVHSFHGAFSREELPQIEADCRAGTIGCVQCKRNLAGRLQAAMAPLQERRRFYLENPGRVDEVLAAGSEKARRVAAATMHEVREAMKI
ncbi:MAG: tryptophan--tRNA ligase [Bacillota bacterium]